MKTDPIVYQDDRLDLKIMLRPALIADGLRFSIWQSEAFKEPLSDPTEQYTRAVVHPICCAALDPVESHISVDGESWPLPPNWERFKNLPALPIEVLNQWHRQALELNPQWTVPEDSEKKESAMTSTSD